MESEMASLHEPLATKAELLAAIADLRADLTAASAGMEGRLSRWVLTCILGQTAVMAGFGYFLLAHWKS